MCVCVFASVGAYGTSVCMFEKIGKSLSSCFYMFVQYVVYLSLSFSLCVCVCVCVCLQRPTFCSAHLLESHMFAFTHVQTQTHTVTLTQGICQAKNTLQIQQFQPTSCELPEKRVGEEEELPISTLLQITSLNSSLGN